MTTRESFNSDRLHFPGEAQKGQCMTFEEYSLLMEQRKMKPDKPPIIVQVVVIVAMLEVPPP